MKAITHTHARAVALTTLAAALLASSTASAWTTDLGGFRISTLSKFDLTTAKDGRVAVFTDERTFQDQPQPEYHHLYALNPGGAIGAVDVMNSSPCASWMQRKETTYGLRTLDDGFSALVGGECPGVDWLAVHHLGAGQPTRWGHSLPPGETVQAADLTPDGGVLVASDQRCAWLPPEVITKVHGGGVRWQYSVPESNRFGGMAPTPGGGALIWARPPSGCKGPYSESLVIEVDGSGGEAGRRVVDWGRHSFAGKTASGHLLVLHEQEYERGLYRFFPGSGQTPLSGAYVSLTPYFSKDAALHIETQPGRNEVLVIGRTDAAPGYIVPRVLRIDSKHQVTLAPINLPTDFGRNLIQQKWTLDDQGRLVMAGIDTSVWPAQARIVGFDYWGKIAWERTRAGLSIENQKIDLQLKPDGRYVFAMQVPGTQGEGSTQVRVEEFGFGDMKKK